MAARNAATAHMFIISPFHAHSRYKLFSTHPATGNRVAALRQYAEWGEMTTSPSLPVTSREVIWLFLEHLWFELVPVLHRLQWRLAAQG